MREEIQAVERQFVIPAMFKEIYEKVEVLLTYKLIFHESKPCLYNKNTISSLF